MRRGLAIAALGGGVAATAVACNLLTGVGSLTADDDALAGDAAGDRFIAEGSTTLVDGGVIADGAVHDAKAPYEAGYVCSGASCFDAGTCPGNIFVTAGPCPVRIFAGGTGNVHAITADSNGVYWTIPAAQRIDRLLATASAPDTLIAVPDGTPQELASSGGDVFWSESDSGRVRRISAKAAAGSQPSATITNQGVVTVLGIGSGGVALAWADASGKITSASTGFAFPTTIATGQAPVVGVGLYSLESFWASAGSSGAIRSGADKSNLVPTPDVRSLVVDPQRLYWTEGSSGLVGSATHNGANRTMISGEGEPVAIAVDDASMYWVNIADGRVRTSPLGVTTATTLASGQSRPRAIAVSGRVVYWVNDTGGEVWSLHL